MSPALRGPDRPRATLGDALRAAADSDLGVRFLDRRERPTVVGYGALLRRALQVAGGLQGLGVRPGDRVGLVLPTGPLFYDAFFGCSLGGAVPVPLYPPVRLGRLDEYHRRSAAMLRSVGARLILTDGALRRLLGPTVVGSAPDLGCLTPAELPDHPMAPTPTGPQDLAFIQLSSGTTGEPRPIALTHAQVRANVEAILGAILQAYPEEGGFRHAGVSWLPLYHDMGLVGCVLVALAHPGALTLLPPELFLARPAAWLRAIARYQGTISPAPNFAYSLCADRITDEELAGLDLSSWRVALNGAEPISPSVLERFITRFAAVGFRREALTPVYGLAEATLAVTFSRLDQPLRILSVDREALQSSGEAREVPASGHALSLVSLGPPLPGFAVQVVGTDDNPLPEGRLGRVLVRGPSLMKGTIEADGATRAVPRDGWLDTGDQGFLWQGELYLFGRCKDLIIVAGRNHAPQEFEQAIDDLPGLRRGCAMALGLMPDGGDGEELVLLVERARDSAMPDAAVETQIRARVVEKTGVLPRRVLLVEPGTLPRTSSGKLRRAEAKQRLVLGELTPPEPVTALRMAGHLVRSHLALWRHRRGH